MTADPTPREALAHLARLYEARANMTEGLVRLSEHAESRNFNISAEDEQLIERVIAAIEDLTKLIASAPPGLRALAQNQPPTGPIN